MSIKRKQATLAIHGNETQRGTSGPVVTPIYQSSTYIFPNSEAVEGYMVRDEREHYIYGRYGSPAEDKLNHTMAMIEGSEDALFFSTGMAAITTAVHCTVEPGDEIIAIPALYGYTYNFFTKTLPKFNIKAHIVDIDQLYDLEKIVNDKTKLIYFESPTNPNIQLVNIKKVVEKAKTLNIMTMIDNTFASPINQLPISLGVDVSVYSGTKYLGGHSDFLSGVVAGSKEFIDKCQAHRKVYGAIIDPSNVFLMQRSLKTLEVRVTRQNENAMKFAQHFQKHPKVKAVHFPGLEDNEFHEIAKKQMSGFGGMLALEPVGGLEEAKKVVDTLEIALNATSLGGVETLASIPVITSHVWLNKEELAKAKVSQSMIRISIGLEDIDDIINDFEQALSVI